MPGRMSRHAGPPPDEPRRRKGPARTSGSVTEHAFLQILREDGVAIPDTAAVEKRVQCWAPGHRDSNPSMYVNATTGQYKCHGCHIEGNAWTYLREFRGLTGRKAFEVLTGLGWQPDRIEATEQRAVEYAEERDRQRAGMPRHTERYYFESSIVATHDYRTAEGDLVCRLQRHNRALDPKLRNEFITYVPAADGGWWVCQPDHTGLPPGAGHKGKMPLYRLPALLETELRHPVFVVEGEKCADAIAEHIPVVSGWNGTNAVGETDWTPLAGRKCYLVADADPPGRRYMETLARTLARLECKILLALPPGGDREKGWDVADEYARGGWEGVTNWLKPFWEPYELQEEFALDPAAPDLGDNECYQVLGFEDDKVVIQEKGEYQQLHYIASTRVNNADVQQSFAPLRFWKRVAGERTRDRTFLQSVGDELLETARRRGQVSVADAYGRGAFLLEGDVGYHIGAEILMPDEAGRLTVPVSLSDASVRTGRLFTPRPRMAMRDDDAARDYAADLFATIMEYRWSKPDHGRMYLGWMVASMIGGALTMRPVVWLLGHSSSGKSALLEYTLDPLHDGFRQGLADATGAGLTAALGSDSLPVSLDEFEPNPHERGSERVRHILDVMRQATGGTARTIRGTAEGGHRSSRPRFSLLLSSVSQPKISAADESRVVTIALGRDGVDNWPTLYRQIRAATTRERMAAIRTEIVRDAPQIVADITALADRLQEEGVDTRQAQAMAALSAGAGWLSGEPMHRWPLLKKPARAMGHVADDVVEPLRAVLGVLQPRLGVSIAELLYRGWTADGKLIRAKSHTGGRGDEKAREDAQRLGFRVLGGRVLMALGCQQVKQTLMHTAYSGYDIDNQVLMIPGVNRYKSRDRDRAFFGRARYAAAVLPDELVEDLGIFAHDEEA